MGTSSVRPAPRAREWKKVVSGLAASRRQVVPIVSRTLRIILPTLPFNQVVFPLFYGAYEGVRFALHVRRYGLERALKKEGIRIAETFIAPRLSDVVWDKVSTKLPAGSVNSPIGKLSEAAFKKTMNTILVKGVEAGVELI